MPPAAGRRIGDDFVDDSDSDVSITGLDDDHNKTKGKGKGKAVDKRKKDKGKGKAKDVSTYRLRALQFADTLEASLRVGGHVHAILGHGTGG